MENGIEELFFEELVREIEKITATAPIREYDEGWNGAVRTCVRKIYHFFGRGNPPNSVSTEHTVNDTVNHPAHYTSGRIEVIDFIEDQKLGYHLGNAVKYICRAGKKDPAKTAEDLRKAVWYLERYISQTA